MDRRSRTPSRARVMASSWPVSVRPQSHRSAIAFIRRAISPLALLGRDLKMRSICTRCSWIRSQRRLKPILFPAMALGFTTISPRSPEPPITCGPHVGSEDQVRHTMSDDRVDQSPPVIVGQGEEHPYKESLNPETVQ